MEFGGFCLKKNVDVPKNWKCVQIRTEWSLEEMFFQRLMDNHGYMHGPNGVGQFYKLF